MVATLLGTAAATAGRDTQELFFIGTRGSNAREAVNVVEPLAGQVQGIYAARLDSSTGQPVLLGQVAQLNRALWLAVHPRLPVLYAVHGAPGPARTSPSSISSFAIRDDSGRLQHLNAVDAGGKDATHLALDMASATVFSANHGDGSVSALPLRADGSLGAVSSVQVESGSGPVAGRQESAQAHAVAVDPSGRFILVSDIGADHVFIYRFNSGQRTLALSGSQALPPGSGPRHLLFDRRGRFLYVLTDLTSTVHVFRWDAAQGRLRPRQQLSAYPADYAGSARTGGAEVALSRDGRFAYVSVRGDQDCIVAYAVNRNDGTLKEIQRQSVGGKSPRGFALDPSGQWLLATNDGTDTVSVLAVDPATGRLAPTALTLAVPGTVSIVFDRRLPR